MGGFNLKTTAENLLLWEQRIQERIQNAISVDEWCLKNGITKHQYYYWSRRVREKQKTDEGIVFADITSAISKDDPKGQNQVLMTDFQIFINNIRVTVPNEFNPGSLAGLIKVLQAL